MKTKKSIPVIITFLLLSLPVCAQEHVAVLTKADQENAIARIGTLLNRFYVFPDIAAQMEKHIKDELLSGTFEKITDSREFANSVTQELRSVSDDKHLGLFFGINPDLQPNEDKGLKRILDRINTENQNYGLDKIEILPGNIGYMRIRSVMFPEEVKKIIASALQFLSKTDAIIFDLRVNHGGDQSYLAYFFSYFFNEPTQISGLYWRDRDRTDEYWTQDSVPGMKMPDVPLFVLISHQTFSGAEAFAYDLQSLKRATVVGEVSSGGAHPSSSFVVLNDMRISIPLGRAINPVTGTNWEKVGVRPDIETSPDSALSVAREMASVAAEKYHEIKKNKILAVYKSYNENIKKAAQLYEKGETEEADQLIAASLKNAVSHKLLNERQINQMGYDYLEQNQCGMAVAILGFNASSFPESANTYDSLGEACLKCGNKILAKESYRKALELDPTNENARQNIEKIDKEGK